MQQLISSDDAIVTVNQESAADEVMDYVLQCSRHQPTFDFSAASEIYEFTCKQIGLCDSERYIIICIYIYTCTLVIITVVM